MHRFQEWLADRVSFVQYPNITPADQSTRQASGLHFKYQMPFGKRIDIFIISMLLLVVGILALGAVLLFFYLLL